ncbi:MAG TPA: hypothetical protein VM936_16465 [Pyrinomonadaceae bacterium]|jgi:hypothetical protein|nr:hypothetical protein [Pyrinomonadaceae bacterium]
MDETRKTDAGGESAGTRDEEATSGETLSDIEENEKVSTGGSSGSDGGSSLEGSSPEPDSGGEGRADGSDSGGPM